MHNVQYCANWTAETVFARSFTATVGRENTKNNRTVSYKLFCELMLPWSRFLISVICSRSHYYCLKVIPFSMNIQYLVSFQPSFMQYASISLLELRYAYLLFPNTYARCFLKIRFNSCAYRFVCFSVLLVHTRLSLPSSVSGFHLYWSINSATKFHIFNGKTLAKSTVQRNVNPFRIYREQHAQTLLALITNILA